MAHLADRWVGAALLAAGVQILVGAAGIEGGQLYGQVGPRTFPYLIGGGLLLVGFLLAAVPWLALGTPAPDPSARGDPIDPIDPIHWQALLWLVAGAAISMLLIKPLGFVLAEWLLFVCCCKAFGQLSWWRSAWVGAVLVVVAYGLFTRLLKVQLGAGILPF